MDDPRNEPSGTPNAAEVVMDPQQKPGEKRRNVSTSPEKVSPEQKKYRTTNSDSEGNSAQEQVEEEPDRAQPPTNTDGNSRDPGGNDATSCKVPISKTFEALKKTTEFFKNHLQPDITQLQRTVTIGTEKKIKNQVKKLPRAEEVMRTLTKDLIKTIEKSAKEPSEHSRDATKELMWRTTKEHEDTLMKVILQLQEVKRDKTSNDVKAAIEALVESGKEFGYLITDLSNNVDKEILNHSNKTQQPTKEVKIVEILWEINMQFNNKLKQVIAEINTDLQENTVKTVKDDIRGLRDIEVDLDNQIERLNATQRSSKPRNEFQKEAHKLKNMYHDRMIAAVTRIKQGTKKRNTKTELVEHVARLRKESGQLGKLIEELNKNCTNKATRQHRGSRQAKNWTS